MGAPWNVMNKIRSTLRGNLGRDIVDIDRFFTYDRQTKQIVSNQKINGWHFIFDGNGNLIKQHQHKN
jgi:hypothetical protein